MKREERNSRSIIINSGVMAVIVIAVMYALSFSSVDSRWDWNDGIRTLKVCLDSTGCMAGFKDSLDKAIDYWNNAHVGWTLEYTTNCSEAQVVVVCKNISSIGLWRATVSNGRVERCSVFVDTDTDWGTCNDKVEVVSTLVHELGHALRLNDRYGTQDVVMRGEQDTTGHLYAPQTEDSTEARQASSTQRSSTRTTPSGGRRQTTYSGEITPAEGSEPFNLSHSYEVMIVPFDPHALQDPVWEITGENSITWLCDIQPEADHTEAYDVVIDYGDSLISRQGFLHVVDNDWIESWYPLAVAPNDTIISGGEPEVILDATRSRHPGGFDKMTFEWALYEGTSTENIYKGPPLTSAYLSPGSHDIELRVMDLFGNWSYATFNAMIEGGALECEVTVVTPYVPSIRGTVLFDVGVTNVGSIPYSVVIGELQPVIGDCVSGARFDFDITRELTTNLEPGDIFYGRYYYYTGNNNAYLPDLVAVNVQVGDAVNSYQAEGCDEFFFYDPWGRSGSYVTPWKPGGFWGERDEFSSNIPYKTELGRNYPNPFNASTTIPFSLAEGGHISIKIYNVAGQLVETVFEGYKDAGHHTVIWDASTVASGIYFYKLESGESVSIKRMSLIK